MTPEELFASVAEALKDNPRVTQAKMFGSPGLRIGNKVFACLVRGELVVKLPQERVDAIVASGEGKHFDPGMGRLMREWVALPPSSADAWLRVAAEARDFVASGL